ncbi:MAG TPA: helix-hairpin-helix domain-containing protein [Egibacteraceae bacterium]|nr:helix-hairpin-helix domain-containing protein [Egibacteraceae bacterium]
MPLFKKPKGKPEDAANPPQRDLEREAAAQLEATRREAAGRMGGSRVVGPAPSAPPVGGPAGTGSERPFRPPSAPAASFGTPPSSGAPATPSDERRAITDMALEDLEARRQGTGGRTQYLATPAKAAADELERRRPPAPGETLPGVPPPHIPSEDLRDQALREILERKERLDREYQERQARAGGGAGALQGGQASGGGPAAAPAAPPKRKTRLHAVAEKRKQLLEAKEGGSATEPATVSAPIRKRSAPKPEPAPEPASAPDSTTTTTGESVEEALAAVKGVGPVIRSALLERFDSVEAIRSARTDELTEVDGIGPALASRIKTSL